MGQIYRRSAWEPVARAAPRCSRGAFAGAPAPARRASHGDV